MRIRGWRNICRDGAVWKLILKGMVDRRSGAEDSIKELCDKHGVADELIVV